MYVCEWVHVRIRLVLVLPASSFLLGVHMTLHRLMD